MLNHIPDMNRLKVFYVVCSSGSITAASAQLHVTKSAISQTMRTLENEVGETLFVVQGRTLVLTQAARDLFSSIEPYLLLLEERFAKKNDAKSLSGIVRISAPPVFGQKYLLPAIAAFRKSNPGVRFQLHLTAFNAPLRQLEDDAIDFCIVDSLESMYGARSYFYVRQLMTDPEYVVCSAKYLKSRYKKEPAYDDLIQENFISYHERGAEICEWFNRSFKRKPDRIDPILVVDRADAVLSAVQRRMGLGLVPLSMIKKEIANKHLIAIGGKRYPYLNDIVLVRLEAKKMPIAQARFQEYLEKVFRK